MSVVRRPTVSRSTATTAASTAGSVRSPVSRRSTTDRRTPAPARRTAHGADGPRRSPRSSRVGGLPSDVSRRGAKTPCASDAVRRPWCPSPATRAGPWRGAVTCPSLSSARPPTTSSTEAPDMTSRSTHDPGRRPLDASGDHLTDPLDGVDPRFVTDWHEVDDVADGQRFTTYWDVEPLSRGPQPPPDWLVVDRAAVDTDLGVLKTGKEADVFLLERARARRPWLRARGQAVPLERAPHLPPLRRLHRGPHGPALARRPRAAARDVVRARGRGRAVGLREWDALVRLQRGRRPGPLPGPGRRHRDPHGARHRCRRRPGAAARAGRPARSCWPILAPAARRDGRPRGDGAAHGDLSPYNILATGERLVVLIDLPQLVDIVANPAGQDFLLRDCRNVTSWFRSRGLDCRRRRAVRRARHAGVGGVVPMRVSAGAGSASGRAARRRARHRPRGSPARR